MNKPDLDSYVAHYTDFNDWLIRRRYALLSGISWARRAWSWGRARSTRSCWTTSRPSCPSTAAARSWTTLNPASAIVGLRRSARTSRSSTAAERSKPLCWHTSSSTSTTRRPCSRSRAASWRPVGVELGTLWGVTGLHAGRSVDRAPAGLHARDVSRRDRGRRAAEILCHCALTAGPMATILTGTTTGLASHVRSPDIVAWPAMGWSVIGE
jgi:hypothetical protein